MTVADLISLVLLVLIAIVAVSYEYFERKTGVAVFPTMPRVRDKIIELLKKDVEARSLPSYTVLDLGSGSGQMARRIALALPQTQVIGIELASIPWLRSIIRQRLFGPSNLVYKRLDFWPYDISAANAVITYLPGRIMDRVGEKLRKELKPGTLVLANTFYLRYNWEPLETHTLHAPFKTNLYVYRQT